MSHGISIEELSPLLQQQIQSGGTSYNATITDIWTGTSAPFSQQINITGLLSSNDIIVYPVYSSDNATAILESEAWSKISNITTNDGSITVTCFEDKPDTPLNIKIKVV